MANQLDRFNRLPYDVREAIVEGMELEYDAHEDSREGCMARILGGYPYGDDENQVITRMEHVTDDELREFARRSIQRLQARIKDAQAFLNSLPE